VIDDKEVTVIKVEAVEIFGYYHSIDKRMRPRLKQWVSCAPGRRRRLTTIAGPRYLHHHGKAGVSESEAGRKFRLGGFGGGNPYHYITSKRISLSLS
jgi:hypothetical protein